MGVKRIDENIYEKLSWSSQQGLLTLVRVNEFDEKFNDKSLESHYEVSWHIWE